MASASDTARLDTFPKWLIHNAAIAGSDTAFREKELGIWHDYTWADSLERVRLRCLGLHKLGLKRGEIVTLIGKARPGWVWNEIAAHGLGAVTLGVYPDALAKELGYLVSFSESTFAMVEDEEQVDKFFDLADTIPSIRHIIYNDERGMRKHDDPRLVSIARLEEMGRELDSEQPGLFQSLVDEGNADDVAILCTTSGTTSNPKLARLKFGPFLEHVEHYLKIEPRAPTDEYVSLLPLPWIVEQVFVFGMGLMSRYRISFAEDIDTAMHDLREIAPTHVMFAPRVWEQIAADMRSRILDADPFTQRMFNRAVDNGLKALDAGEQPGWLDRQVLDVLRDRLGFSRVKAAATGGSALGPDTFRFMLALGIPLKQLYGQTEACGAYTLQRPEHGLDYDSSGVAFGNVELRIKEPDEQGLGAIEVRHSGMFSGYYNNDEATAETMSDDGWLITGDAGRLDDKQRLTIYDRVNDIATTSKDIRFSPQFIENKLKFSPYIGECVVLGDKRPFLSAIVCIRYSMVSKWAEQKGLAFTSYSNLSANPEVAKLLEGEVEKVNESLTEGQKLRRFLLLFKELDPDDGELTRTRKVRRRVVDERYASLIDAIYDGSDEGHINTEVTFEDGRTGRMEADLNIFSLSSQATEAAA